MSLGRRRNYAHTSTRTGATNPLVTNCLKVVHEQKARPTPGHLSRRALLRADGCASLRTATQDGALTRRVHDRAADLCGLGVVRDRNRYCAAGDAGEHLIGPR